MAKNKIVTLSVPEAFIKKASYKSIKNRSMLFRAALILADRLYEIGIHPDKAVEHIDNLSIKLALDKYEADKNNKEDD